MGHLNVRFYVAHATEALTGLAAALAMTRAFTPHATSTLIVREHHIRFLKEARVGDPLHLTVGLVDLDETGATILQQLFHSLSGERSAVVQTRVAHVRAKDGQAFGWPASARALARDLMMAIPSGCEARSLVPGAPAEAATLRRAEELGLVRYSAGAFTPRDCDVFGRVGAAELAGRLGDGGAQAVGAIRDAIGPPADGAGPMGMAVVEYRLVYRRWPGAGDRFDTRWWFKAAEPRRLRQSHWMLDPETGEPWAEAHAVLVPFDLERRKATTLPAHALEALAAKVVRFDG